MMNNNSLFFNLISVFIIFSTIYVVMPLNSLYCLLFFVQSFIFFSFILTVLECKFIALVIIMINVGVILVLLLFLVIMVDFKILMFYNYIYFSLYKLSGAIVIITIYFVLLDQVTLNADTIAYIAYYASDYYIYWSDIKMKIYAIQIIHLMLLSDLQ